MGGGLSLLIRLRTRSAWRRFESAADDPDGAQRELWARISRACEGSPFWGKRWGPKAPALDELPLTEYADYQPAFEAAFEGNRSPTTNEPIIQWGVTSATTATTPKRFPLAVDWDRQSRTALLACAYSISRAAQLPLKPVLLLFSTGMVGSSPAGLPVGYTTARMLLSNATRWRRRLTAIPYEVASHPEHWIKYAPLYAIARDVSLLLGLTPAFVAQFHESLISRMDSYWPYLEGAKHLPASLPPLRVSRKRLQYLRSVFKAGSPGFKAIWPSLGAVVCWTTASASASMPLLEKLIDGVPLLDYGFSSTESGPATIPLYDGKEGHPLHPCVNVVELLPEGAAPEPRNVIPASQAEPGRRYEMIVTNLTGLVRYRIHDIFECTGFYRRTPRLAFRSKAACFATVGSISIAEDDAVRFMLQQGLTLRNDVMLGPHPFKQCFVLYIKEGSGQAPQVEAFDRILCEAGKAYGYSRKVGALDAMQAVVVPASHPMWVRGTHAQAKDRYVLSQAPDDLTS